MTTVAEMDDTLRGRIQELCAVGDDFAEGGDCDAALSKYQEAWDLIPSPRQNWNAATWILTAIADVNFLNGRAAPARQALERAMTCPGAIGNPFIHLRYGQVSLDLGHRDKAADELMRAYMGGGTEIFANENPKYLSFLRVRL